MPALEREAVDITAVIRNILDNYPAGSAVLREFLQNSDDCGAHYQDFILDTRTFPTEALVDPELASCQGPALFAVNDGQFSEKDWKALKHIHNSSKTADEATTGKYGLGFRSCYHVTDNPHILSGNKLLILDPHNRVENYEGGFSLRLDNDEDRLPYADHFRTFKSVLKEEDKAYNGTAIRLPLRHQAQATGNGIKTEPTSIEDVDNMFENFIQKELHNVLLFLKNITRIRLYKIESDEDGEGKLIACASVEDPESVAPHRSKNRGKDKESIAYELRIRVKNGDSDISQSWILTQFVEDYQAAQRIMTTHCGHTLSHLMALEKLFPHVALAYPIPGAATTTIPIRFSRKLFTLLPLPIVTGFPLHIHAIFALASSRQNLRNRIDVAPGSREEFLVKWNRTIFFRFVPKAWVALLKYASNTFRPRSMALYDLWPEADGGEQVCWKGLSNELLQHAAPEQIWPVPSQHLDESSGGYYKLDHILITPVNAATELLTSLANCGVLTSSPPAHVYNLVQNSEKHSPRVMTPSSVAKALRSNKARLSGMALESRTIISEYIATGNDINLFQEIPVIPGPNGTWTSIESNNNYILATTTETDLFNGINPHVYLLDRERIGQRTKALLISAKRKRSLHVVQAVDVVDFLQRKCSSGTETILEGVGEETIGWLVRFWNWVGGWQEAPKLWSQSNLRGRINKLPCLPLDDEHGTHEVRLFNRGSINPAGLDSELLQVFRELRLPILHSGVTIVTSVLQHGIRLLGDVRFLLSEVCGQQSFPLSQPCCKRLHDYLTTHLPALQPRLLPTELEVLRLLPVYPILPTGLRTPRGYTFAVGPESSWLVDDTVEVVPVIEGKLVIAASECRPILAAIYIPEEMQTKRESEVLEQAIDTWNQQQQDDDLSSLLVGRIINRLGDLPPQALELVARLPIVDVGRGPSDLRCPAETVDPSSSIARLYHPDEGVLPQGSFALDSSKPYLGQLRGLMLSTVSSSVVIERIGHLTDPAKEVRNKAARAKALLELLDDLKTPEAVFSTEVVHAITSSPWLPTRNTYCRSSEGWDRRRADLLLCNRVLQIVNYVVSTPRLRKVLGWQKLPFDVLKNQYLKIVSDVTPDRKTITLIIQALARCLGSKSCSEADLEDLAQALDGKACVPTSDGRCLPLRSMVLESVDLGSRFHQTPRNLMDDQRVLRCFRVMGVPNRPTYDALYNGLADISSELKQPDLDENAKRILVSTSLKILSEVFHRDSSIARVDRSRILIPTSTFLLHPVDSTFFNDMSSDISGNEDTFRAHPDISASFADTMGLVRLSDRKFATEDDLLGDLQLGEDFCGRIKGVLKDYKIESASIEWIANADDAKATHVAFVIDRTSFKGSDFLTPQSAEQCQGPSLIIWNNKTFAKGDFEGLLSTGKGGKQGNSEVIGRFGLGALSFYHFTEMAMVVSGDRVLFLDPSGTYLPRNARRSQRTALLMKLETCQSKYPDHLRPLDGLFEFSGAKPYYNGTLFRLPLRTLQQAVTSKLSNHSYSVEELHGLMKGEFYEQAEQSLFFSHIVGLSAHERNPGEDGLIMWSIHGSRQPNATEIAGDQLEGDLLESAEMRLEVTVKNGPSRVQDWLIHSMKTRRDRVPEGFHHLLDEHRLSSPSVGLAIKLTARDAGNQDLPVRSRLFATVPLPIETKFPVHINATWILAGDRRTIRLDTKNAPVAQPMETQYNLYLLKRLVPELYLRMLATLAAQYPQDWNQCWPAKTRDDFKPLVDELYKQFAGTPHRVCRTVTGEVVAPPAAVFSTSDALHAKAVLETLTLPQLVHPLPFDKSLVAWKGLNTDDASWVAKTLRLNAEEVKRRFTENLRPSQPASQSSRPSFAKKHLDGII
ncbi:hypothetical protein FRB94_006526 [Tulasnella sp. JGI-2019a]|nr:hypothetical protein FRB94_006526 [Tulasnella sp. JGI-2019a]